MRLRELLTIIDSELTLKVDGESKVFKSKVEVTEELKNYEVCTIESSSYGLVVTLGELRKIASLEELDYSFESGM